MVFSSMIFLFVFFPIILVGYYGVFQNIHHRNIFLLLSSLLFYAWGEPVYVVIMLLSICINFRFGLLIDSQESIDTKKQILAAGIFVNLAFLFVFKYEAFVSGVVVRLVSELVPIRVIKLNLPLPIGISFFTFQAISYLIDVFRKDGQVQKSLLNLGLYISFFPQLVAGPIVRYSTIAEQIDTRNTTYDQFTEGVKRFIIGISKKIILANQFSLVAIESFGADNPSVAFAWLGALCYTLQIYFDFSGYSDMAIGLGKIFGFDFMENFNYPYISRTVTEFWRRWHISLGAWFRDYVYIPLGGSRVNKRRLILNLFIVWFLTGIWHGAAWKYIAWGLLHFSLLVFEKMLKIEKWLKYRVISFIYRTFTMFMIVFGWVIFGEESLRNALSHLIMMAGIPRDTVLIGNDFIKNINNYYVLIIIGLIMSTPILVSLCKKMNMFGSKWFQNYIHIYIIVVECIITMLYILLFLISISYLVIGSHNPFIYFNF